MKEIYHYTLTNNTIEKYKISIDEEKLNKIKLESIYKCGKKTKVSFESTRFFKENICYTDFKQVEIGWREYRDGPDERLYRYSFTEYTPTYLSKLIDAIISSKSETAIRELFQMDLSKEFCGFQRKINNLLNKTSKISDSDYKNKINALNELKTLYEKQEFNKDRISILPYYNDSIKCFNYELIDKITLDEYNKVINFINSNTQIYKDNNNLILTMKEHNILRLTNKRKENN